MKVFERVGSININVIFPNKAFVFGQYKKIDLIFKNSSNIPVDKIYIISSKPLNSGFLVQDFGSVSGNSILEKSIFIRATMLKPFDRIDFLVIYTTKSYIRTFKLCYVLKVSKSFKTKCTVERVDNSRHLVCIDVFDNQDPNLYLEKFFLNSIVMLSNVMTVEKKDKISTQLASDYLRKNNLVYFYINQSGEGHTLKLPREDKQVFYSDDNKIDYNKNIDTDVEKYMKSCELTEKAFMGYLDQENRIIRSEFQTLSQNLKSKGMEQIKFYCKEFLDFEILWYYSNQKEESRNLRLFSKENDNLLMGQHSIISTPIYSVSYKQKKSKNPTGPVFSIRSIVNDVNINHDFKQNK